MNKYSSLFSQLLSVFPRMDFERLIRKTGAEYFVSRKLEHQYVLATLSTHHRRVYIRRDGKLIRSLPFPLTGKAIKPLC